MGQRAARQDGPGAQNGRQGRGGERAAEAVGVAAGQWCPLPSSPAVAGLHAAGPKRPGQRPAGGPRLPQVLEDAQVTRSSVRSASLGGSGLRRRRALGAGDPDAAVLRPRGDPPLRASQAAVQERCPGPRTAPHRFMLEGLWAQGALLDPQSARVEARLAAPRRPCAAPIRRLDTLDGMARVGAQRVGAEVGADRAPCPDAEHLSRWAGMSPGQDERAGKRRRGTTAQGTTWLRRTRTHAAGAATRPTGG